MIKGIISFFGKIKNGKNTIQGILTKSEKQRIKRALKKNKELIHVLSSDTQKINGGAKNGN